MHVLRKHDLRSSIPDASAARIVAEIELLIHRYGAREISFVDDTFTVKRSRIYEIFDLARQRGLRFPWSCMSRVNTVDEDLLQYMRDHGCWYISFGWKCRRGDPPVDSQEHQARGRGTRGHGLPPSGDRDQRVLHGR